MGESGVLLSCRAYDLIHYLRFVLGSNSRRKDIWRHYSKLSELFQSFPVRAICYP